MENEFFDSRSPGEERRERRKRKKRRSRRN